MPVEIHSRPLVVEGQTVLLGIMRDISWRQAAQEALHKKEMEFRALFESSRDAIMILDQQGFIDCNPATLAMFDCASKEEFVGKHPSALSHAQQQDGRDSMTAAGERIEAAYATGSQFFEWLHKRQDGTIFPAEVLLSRVEFSDKIILQAVVRDISERRDRKSVV